MADALIGKVTEIGTRETQTGKTVYRVEVEPLDGSRALTWSAWPEVGEELVTGRTYEFETEIKQGDRAKFYNITKLVREVDPSDSPVVVSGSPTSAPQAESAAVTPRATDGVRYAALRAAIDVWRTDVEFTPTTADGVAASSAGAVIEYADVFVRWLGAETTDAVPLDATQPTPTDFEFKNAGELMAWAASEYRLSTMAVTQMLGVERPSDIDNLWNAGMTIANRMLIQSTGESAANG